MKIADISIRRPVTIAMIMLGALFVGIIAMLSLPLDIYPKMDLPYAVVVTTLPGATPTEVEQQISKPVEEALQSLSGVQEIDSTSLQNVGVVVVQFDYSVNMAQKLEDMRSAVNQMSGTLPKDATTPVVQQFNPADQPIMTVTLSGGQSLAALSDEAKNIIQPALQHVNGVANVDTVGGLTRQITVEVDPGKLAYYHLSISQVEQAVSSANYSADVGQAVRGSQLIPLKVNGQFTSPQELLKVPISAGIQNLSVGDVAQVKDNYKDVTLIANFNGQASVGFSIKQASGANTVKVSAGVHQALQDLVKNLPSGMHLTVVSDSAQGIKDAINVVVEHTLIGFILGILLMLLILRSVRSTVVIGVAIPISILTTFILMYLNHLTINMITLGSLGIALGSLVDFSVVVLESIFRARQRGLGPKEAAGAGTAEVGTAVMVAAMAQIFVFGPSLFTGGIAGQLFGPMALTVTFSHLVALIVALTLTPMLASKLLVGSRFAQEDTIPGKTAPFRPWAPFDWFGRGMHDLTAAYTRVLGWSLKHRKTVVVLAVVLFLAVIPLLSRVGTELMPSVTNNQINVTLTLPAGTSLDETARVTQEVENRIRQHLANVASIYAQIGTVAGFSADSTNSSSLIVTLNLSGNESATGAANDLQPYVDNIPGAKVIVQSDSLAQGPAGGTVQVQITGPDLNTLADLSNQAARIMQKQPYLSYVDNELSTGQPDYELKLSQSALVQNGLTEGQVVSALRTAFQGSTAGTYYQGDNGYDVVVRFPEGYSRDITKLSEVTVMNSAGQSIPLTQVAKTILTQEPTMVTHVGGIRTVYVQANVSGVSTGQAQAELTQLFKSIRIPKGYELGFGQYARFQAEAFRSLGVALFSSVALVYMVMAGMFESLLTPFVIMFSLPPTLVGAVLGLFLTHKTLNMNSLMGLVMLIGLVTNNAIVLVDYTNQLKAKGLSLREALMQAGPVRLRPILLTTVTNVAAMLPLLILGGTGTETLASMAAVITFGLTLSTLVTLVLVPVMYVNMEWLIGKVRPHDRKKPQGPENAAHEDSRAPLGPHPSGPVSPAG
ncbi:Acriflavin resistance protein [Acididesulfobacillus acetoxydans]|uniref:Acriflavin resistance protein n=1 Tax=Acididesulfobacillus acetoxydans TaxID=1561005 RepID=A0A8S0XUN3_9FIRM|nr:efflux RND transporter permease subunit [Acididesulfobacillus acetoxydans]CAA7599607.1 Acriflavin resistance protein [Acididesulfobacillus acetoxydans]CEJ06483.1 Nodulation protein NolG [Acididesulfobacillus acetoxydans]